MKEQIIEDTKKEIEDIRLKLARLEKGKSNVHQSNLAIESFENVIANLYFRIKKLRKFIKEKEKE
jgi:hypothetical protein